jgi:hypothetical protein
VVVTLARRIRLEVHENGIVVVGFVVKRRYGWSEITAFSPMPLSTGRPGFCGAVVVDGVNHEIGALGEPGLYSKLRELNALLEAKRASEGGTYAPPPLDYRRSDWTRRRLTLRLGPGAAWWPDRNDGSPSADQTDGDS